MRDATPFIRNVTFRTTKQWTHTSVPRELKRDFRFFSFFFKINFQIVILDEYHTERNRERIYTPRCLNTFIFFSSLLMLLLFARLIRTKVNKGAHTHLLYSTMSGRQMWSDGTCSICTPPYSFGSQRSL